jgi:hypothetical protein
MEQKDHYREKGMWHYPEPAESSPENPTPIL